jgi:hypothetical protein
VNFIQAFLAGMFLTNTIPHLIKGILGENFITLFKRKSSPYLNIFYGFVNLVLFYLILGFNPQTRFLNLPKGTNFWAFNAGVYFMAAACAWLFKKKNPRMPWHKD